MLIVYLYWSITFMEIGSNFWVILNYLGLSLFMLNSVFPVQIIIFYLIIGWTRIIWNVHASPNLSISQFWRKVFVKLTDSTYLKYLAILYEDSDPIFAAFMANFNASRLYYSDLYGFDESVVCLDTHKLPPDTNINGWFMCLTVSRIQIQIITRILSLVLFKFVAAKTKHFEKYYYSSFKKYL